MTLLPGVHRLPSRSDLFHAHVAEFAKSAHHAEAGRAHAVHRARVASRRLRELLPTVEADAEDCRRALKHLRRATRQLGRLRELDASVALLDNSSDSARGQSGGVRLLRERLVAARQVAFEKAERQGLGRKLRRIAKRLAHIADGLSDGRPLRDRRWRRALDARVAHRARALVVAIDEAGSAYVPERVHDVRIALKKLHYAVELAQAASGLQAATELRRLAGAQSRLGRLHDRQILLGWVADVRASLGARAVSVRRDLRALSADLEAQCRVLHAAYVRSGASLRGACQRMLARTDGAAGTRRQVRIATRLRQVRLA